MSMLENINWNRQAKHFLEQHGWEFDEHGMATHKLFPFAEDFSMGRFEKFCKDFYNSAWVAYMAYIRGTVILNEREEGESN